MFSFISIISAVTVLFFTVALGYTYRRKTALLFSAIQSALFLAGIFSCFAVIYIFNKQVSTSIIDAEKIEWATDTFWIFFKTSTVFVSASAVICAVAAIAKHKYTSIRRWAAASAHITILMVTAGFSVITANNFIEIDDIIILSGIGLAQLLYIGNIIDTAALLSRLKCKADEKCRLDEIKQRISRVTSIRIKKKK